MHKETCGEARPSFSLSLGEFKVGNAVKREPKYQTRLEGNAKSTK
jgi:hypothetical protein